MTKSGKVEFSPIQLSLRFQLSQYGGFIVNYPPLPYAHAAMQLTINVPDFLLDDVRNQLAAQPTGILEAVALDAILGYLDGLRKNDPSNQSAE